MFSVHGWKAVVRDALLIYIFSFALGFLLHALWKLPIRPSSLDIWLHVGIGFSIIIVAFGVIGTFTKEMMWRHLIRISIVLLLFSTIRNYFRFSMQMGTLNEVLLFSTIWIPFVEYSIALSLGGTIATIVRGRRGQNGAQANRS